MTVKGDHIVRVIWRKSLKTTRRSFIGPETARACFNDFVKNPNVLYAVYANRNGVIYREKTNANPAP